MQGSTLNVSAALIADLMAIELLIIAMYCGRSLLLTKTRKDLQAIRILFIGAIAMAFFDLLAFVSDGRTTPFWEFMNMASNSINYLGNCWVPVGWLTFLKMHLYGDNEKTRKFIRNYVVISSLLTVVIAANIFTPIIFSINRNNVYQREWGSYAFVFYLAVCMTYSIWDYFRFKHKNRNIRFFPIGVFLGPITIGYLLQMLFFYGVSLSWISMAFSMVATLLSLQNESAFVDQLTGILNRNFLYSTTVFRKMHGGIMCDLNNFKYINDTFGHKEGDNALEQFAGILQHLAMEHGCAVRYAGDEFFIFTTESSFSLLVDLNERLKNELENYNAKSRKPYQLLCSSGYGTFDPKKESIDDVVRKLDAKMYTDKQHFYAEHGELSRRR